LTKLGEYIEIKIDNNYICRNTSTNTYGKAKTYFVMTKQHVNLPNLPPQQENQSECTNPINYNVDIGKTDNEHMMKIKQNIKYRALLMVQKNKNTET
jgi:hypothetical protein